MIKHSGIRPRYFDAHKAARVSSIVALALSATTLAGCAGVSEVTKQRVASSAVTIQQAQETVGRSEDGMVELQHAKESLGAAQQAIAKTDEKTAQRMAERADLHAHLAVAQSQTADARRAAAEVAAGTDALRKESERAPPTALTP